MTTFKDIQNQVLNIKDLMLFLKDTHHDGGCVIPGNDCDSIVQFYLEINQYIIDKIEEDKIHPVYKRPRWDKNRDQDEDCRCGHPYTRHFDPYEDWDPVGCKYCGCPEFERPKESYKVGDNLPCSQCGEWVPLEIDMTTDKIKMLICNDCVNGVNEYE